MKQMGFSPELLDKFYASQYAGGAIPSGRTGAHIRARYAINQFYRLAKQYEERDKVKAFDRLANLIKYVPLVIAKMGVNGGHFHGFFLRITSQDLSKLFNNKGIGANPYRDLKPALEELFRDRAMNASEVGGIDLSQTNLFFADRETGQKLVAAVNDPQIIQGLKISTIDVSPVDQAAITNFFYSVNF